MWVNTIWLISVAEWRNRAPRNWGVSSSISSTEAEISSQSAFIPPVQTDPMSNAMMRNNPIARLIANRENRLRLCAYGNGENAYVSETACTNSTTLAESTSLGHRDYCSSEHAYLAETERDI